MKVKNLNSSSRKTKQLIKENFAVLMNEKKELHAITVTELVKRAGITRSSFYTHYSSIYDVVKDIQDETLVVLNTKDDCLNSLNDFYDYLDNIFKYLKENDNIYKMVLKSNEAHFFTAKLNNIITKKLYEALNTNDKYLLLNVHFFTDGCINLIIKYYRNELNTNLNEINEYIKKLFSILFIRK